MFPSQFQNDDTFQQLLVFLKNKDQEIGKFEIVTIFHQKMLPLVHFKFKCDLRLHWSVPIFRFISYFQRLLQSISINYYFSVDHSLKMLALTGDGIEKVNKSLAK